MEQISNMIEQFVRSIKQDEIFCDICFVKGFSKNDYPDPFSDYMIAVSTLDSHLSSQFVGDIVAENLKGSLYEVSVKFRIYAPKNDGGDGLIGLSNQMCESIRKHDEKNVCQDVTISPIAFDDEAKTVYRDIVALMSFCVYEEVSR